MPYNIRWTQDLYTALSPQRLTSLLDTLPDATVFNDWPWLSACWDHCESDVAPWLLLAENSAGDLLACIALRVKREKLHGLTRNVVRWLQFPFGDRMVPLVSAQSPDIIDALINAFYSAPFAWDCMIWDEVPGGSGLEAVWQEAALHRGVALRTHEKSQCPVLNYQNRQRAEIESSTPKSVKQRVKRARKRLMQEKNVEILHYRPGPEKIMQTLSEFKHVEDQSWKGDEGLGIFSTDSSWAFFQTVAQRMAEKGQVDAGEIRIDGELASYRFGMNFRNVFLDYNLAYLPCYHKIGLGRVLLDELIYSCADQHYTAIDASRVGTYSTNIFYERNNALIPHVRWYWYRLSFASLSVRIVVELLKPAARQVRQWWKSRKNNPAASAEE